MKLSRVTVGPHDVRVKVVQHLGPRGVARRHQVGAGDLGPVVDAVQVTMAEHVVFHIASDEMLHEKKTTRHGKEGVRYVMNMRVITLSCCSLGGVSKWDKFCYFRIVFIPSAAGENTYIYIY